MIGASWCHHCHQIFPSFYSLSSKVRHHILQAPSCLVATLYTIIACLHVQNPQQEFVVAQMDYMDRAVKVRYGAVLVLRTYLLSQQGTPACFHMLACYQIACAQRSLTYFTEYAVKCETCTMS